MNKQQLAYDLLDRAIQLRIEDPPQALALLDQGRAFAEEVQLPCLVLNYDRWRANVWLFSRGMILEAIDVLTRAIVEAAKPRYAQCPEKQHLYRLLGQAYFDYDPLGYETEIREIITLLDVPPRDESMRDHWCMIQSMRLELVVARRDFAHAKEEAALYLARCESLNTPFRLADAYLSLTRITARIGDVSEVLRHAQTALNYVENIRPPDGISMRLQALSWLTFANSALGHVKLAQDFEHRVNQHLITMKLGASLPYYDAMCAYYEINNRYEHSLLLRDRNLSGVIKGGSPYFQTECHLKRIRLLKKMGRPYYEDQRQLMEVAKKLKKPEYVYARLDEITTDTSLFTIGAKIIRRWFGGTP